MNADELEYANMQKEREELGLPESETMEEPTIETPTEPVETKEETTEEPKPKEVSDKEEPFDFKAYKKELREELQSDYDKKIEELKAEYEKAKPNETVTTNLEEDIAKLAAEKEIDPEVLKNIIDIARKGVETSPEDKALLEQVKVMQAEREEFEQKQIFETEFKAVLPTLKEQFPNASEEQIEKAKELLDEISHTEKYHDKDIDYVVFKEKEQLAKVLFSPKKATFESARPVTFDESDDFPDFNPNMTPAQFERWEKKRESAMDSMDSAKVRVVSRDDGGRISESWQ
jgi:hypothetical protein